jgi:hypothetical protein
MTVLYIAFGLVALWLLGEVLLQYKARLRWRALAFVGFLTVVVGVVLPSIVVIVLGAIAFAVGQSYVTLSFRKGYSTGWAIGGRPGASRRRRGTAPGAQGGEDAEGAEDAPRPQVADVTAEAPQEQTMVAAVPPDYAQEDAGEQAAAGASTVYAPQPLPDDTGQLYGVYDDTTSGTGQSGLGAAAFAAEGQGGHTEYAATAYDPYGGYEQPAGHETYGTYAGFETYGDQAGQAGQADYARQQYGYGYEDPGGQNAAAAQGGYATYDATGAGSGTGSDPGYGMGDGSGQQQPAADYQQQYTGYDPAYASYEYTEQQQYQDPYATDTPPGGVWMPQQRDNAAEQQGQQPAYDPSYGYDSAQQQPEAGGQYRY